MPGHILQVNVSRGGIPKRPVEQGLLTAAGIEGDACRNPRYHGGPLQAVLLISSEVIDQLAARGFPVFPGALGENLTTVGLDYRDLRVGQQLSIGEALIELTKMRVPCSTLDVYGRGIQKAIYDKAVKAGDTTSPVWGRSGFYARVLQGGWIAPGASIEIARTAA